MLEPIGRSAGCPGIRGQCVNAKSDQRARGNRKRPSGSGPQRQAVLRALIPSKHRRHGQPAPSSRKLQAMAATAPQPGQPQPATAPHPGPGFSRECDHPRVKMAVFDRGHRAAVLRAVRARPGRCWASPPPLPATGRSWPPTAGSATASAPDLRRGRSLAAAEEPPPEPRTTSGPASGRCSRPGRSRQEPAGVADQRADRGQRLRPGPRKKRQHSTAAPAWTPPRSRCSPAARPGAPGCRASDPDGGWYVREGDHREREDDKGKPLSKICWALEATIATTARPPGAPPASRTSPSAWHWPGPAKIPAAPAPACWPPWPPAATRPAGSATTAPIPRPCPSASTSPPARSATSPSWTTAPTSSASRQTPGSAAGRGQLVLPRLARALITATTRLRDHAITGDLYDQQITARCPYQLKHKDGPDADGYQRLSCPAIGKHPRLMCPLRQARCHHATDAPRHSGHHPNRPGSAARRPSPSPPT